MKQPADDAPLVLVKWYAYAKWVLERVESFPKSQRFILGKCRPMMLILAMIFSADITEAEEVRQRGSHVGM